MATSAPTKPSIKEMDTAEAFYRVFCALPQQDRFAVAKYILHDKEIQQQLESTNIPNATTLNAFAEDKASMPTFEMISELRNDLLS